MESRRKRKRHPTRKIRLRVRSNSSKMKGRKSRLLETRMNRPKYSSKSNSDT